MSFSATLERTDHVKWAGYLYIVCREGSVQKDVLSSAYSSRGNETDELEFKTTDDIVEDLYKCHGGRM
jgi:hypothetical protein